MEFVINQPVKIGFSSVALATGLTSFTPRLLIDGVLSAATFTYAEVGGGFYIATFTPTVSGKYTLFIEGQVQARFEVVSKTIRTLLSNLEDEALGSWTWDKNTKVLTFYRQDASVMATFDMQDGLEEASRERLT